VEVVDLGSGRIDTLDGRVGGDDFFSAMVTARMGRTGDLLVTAAEDGTTGVWDVRARRLLGLVDLPAPEDNNTADVWVSPDGRLAATIRTDAGPLVIDLATRRVVRRLPPLPLPREVATQTILQGWTADGRGLLVSRNTPSGDEVLVVDAQTGRQLLDVPLSRSGPNEVAADPRGRFLVVALNDGTVLFLDARNGHRLAPPTSATVGNVFTVSVSPDGRFVTATGSAALVSVFDTRTYRPIGTPLPFDLGTVARARFTRDGRIVVVNANTVSVVDLDPATWVPRACQLVGRTLTTDEWNEVLPNRPYDPACRTPA
jgi:DNA-binding beta-propeller fold protein YncE